MHQVYRDKDRLIIAGDIIDTIETVSLNFLFKTGSKHETVEQNGISHYLEHMAFKGTKKRTAKDIAMEFARIGGSFNAYTGREETAYHVKVLKHDIEAAVDIIADVIQNSIFEKFELERERGVILEEFHQIQDTPDDLVFDKFQEAAFHNQPIGMPIIGNEKNIKCITREDIQKYVSARYSKDNLIISAAGNFHFQDLIKITHERLNALQSKSTKVDIQNVYTGGESRIYKDLEQAHIILGFCGVSVTSSDYYIKQLLAIILGGGMASRLFQEVREKRGLAYRISAFCSSYFDTGVFAIYSATSNNKVNELLSIISQELFDAAFHITEEELVIAKVQLEANLLMCQESSSFRAERMSFCYTAFDRFITIEEVIQKINSVTVKHVQDLMLRILQSGAPTFAAVGDISGIKSYDAITHSFVV